MRRVILSAVVVGAITVLSGCSVTGAAMQGVRIGGNLAKTDSHIRVTLDGQAAKQNAMKKAMSGYSAWKISAPVSTTPTLKFDLVDPERFGRITMVAASLYQQYEADYSHQAEFTVVSRDINNPQAQMKPGTPYNLGSPGGDFNVLNLTSQSVGGIELKPGMKYKLTLTVKADKSETAIVEFVTK
ncbi:MAG: hypothetical protein AB7Q17_18615 [Phycisphaerae bacterium]